MDRRLLTVMAFSFVVLVLYQRWIALRYRPRPAARRGAVATAKDEPDEMDYPAVREKGGGAGTTGSVRVETDQYIALFTARGGRLTSLKLRHYRESANHDAPPVEMVSAEPSGPYPLGLDLGGGEPLDDGGLIYSVRGSDLSLHGASRGALLFQAVSARGDRITKRYGFTGSSYAIDFEASVTGPSQPPPRLLLPTRRKELTRGAPFEGLVAFAHGALVREPSKSLAAGKRIAGPFSWVGFGYTYFLAALIPHDERDGVATALQAGGAAISLGAEDEARTTWKIRSSLFMGPKDFAVLRSFGHGLEHSINFGYFGFISSPLLSVLRFSHGWTGSYGIDIILLTFLIKLALVPLTQKSYAAMRGMKRLQPEIERIKETFKDDQSKVQQELAELYRRHGVNPWGGCLPMLLQIPVLTGLYRTLQTPIELRHAPFLWIKDLSRPDWESLPVHMAGWSFGVPVLTILMGASMIGQQWMSPGVEDHRRGGLALLTPILFTFMFLNFPSGLTIYWLASNTLNIVHQWIANRGPASS